MHVKNLNVLVRWCHAAYDVWRVNSLQLRRVDERHATCRMRPTSSSSSLAPACSPTQTWTRTSSPSSLPSPSTSRRITYKPPVDKIKAIVLTAPSGCGARSRHDPPDCRPRPRNGAVDAAAARRARVPAILVSGAVVIDRIAEVVGRFAQRHGGRAKSVRTAASRPAE